MADDQSTMADDQSTMADDNMNEQKAGEVDEDSERVPSASVAVDDSENQGQGKKRKADDSENQEQGNKRELRTRPTVDTPGFLDPPPPSKLAKLNMNPESWASMATAAATRSQDTEERLRQKFDAMFDREVKSAKEVTGLADVDPTKLTDEDVVGLEDESYPLQEGAESSTDDYDSPDDEQDGLAGDSDVNDEEYDEGLGLTLDDKKAEDEPEDGPGGDEDGAGNSHDASYEAEDDEEAEGDESEDPGTAEDYADMHKAMALQEGVIMDLDEVYEDDVEDMEE